MNRGAHTILSHESKPLSRRLRSHGADARSADEPRGRSHARRERCAVSPWNRGSLLRRLTRRAPRWCVHLSTLRTTALLAGHKFESGSAGRASPRRSMKRISRGTRIPATVWWARSFSAHAVAAIKVTSSRTVRCLHGSATASTRSPSSSRRATSRCPTSWGAALLRANRGPDLRVPCGPSKL